MMDERGFTLVELLVAMVASSLLLLGLGSVAGGLATRVRAPDRATGALLEARGGSALAALVSRAVPSADAEGLVAEPNRLRFPIRGTAGEPLTVTLDVSPDGTRLDAELLDETGAAVPGTRESIVEGASDVAMVAQTVETTSGERRLLGVEVAIKNEDGSERTMAAASRVSARPGCRFDPISLTCRPQ